MISIEHLSFSYGSTQILDDVNFSAEQGKLVALIGPNGAGKSTLFKCILKFLKGYEGRVLLDGRDMKEMSRAEIARKIAYIPQTTIPVFNYAVIDIVLMGMTGGLKLLESPKQKHVEKAEKILEELGILHLRDRGFEPYHTVSVLNASRYQVKPCLQTGQAAVCVPGVILFDHASDCEISDCEISCCGSSSTPS